jgi:hypothetical protein
MFLGDKTVFIQGRDNIEKRGTDWFLEISVSAGRELYEK